MSGRYPSGGGAGGGGFNAQAQSQHERKLARQRQLEMMEATASGTAPSMELDTSAWLHEEVDDPEMETLNILHDDGASGSRRVPTSSTASGTAATPSTTGRTANTIAAAATAGLFRPRDDPMSSNLNLMDHATGRYSDQPTGFFAQFFGYRDPTAMMIRQQQQQQQQQKQHYHDASPGDDIYGSGEYYAPTKQRRRQKGFDGYARVSMLGAFCYQTFCGTNSKRRICNTFLVLSMTIFLVTVALWIANGNSDEKVAQQVYTRNEERHETIQYRLSMVDNITHASVFDNPRSPEYHALRWVSYTDPGRLDPDHPALSYRYALAVFYYNSFVYFQAHAGQQKDIESADMPQYEGVPNPGWTRRDYWMSEKGICHWYGVTCVGEVVDNTDTNIDGTKNATTIVIPDNGAIQAIDLHDNHVFGVFVPEFAALGSSVQSINLKHNKMVGKLSDASVQSLSTLRALDLSENKLSGTLPSGIRGMTALTSFILSNNEIVGAIPDSLGEMSSLKELHWDHNKLDGTIPESISGLKDTLTNLYLNDNLLKGSIPNEITTLTNLEHMEIQANKLTGPLPSNLGDLTALQYLQANDNQLSGRLISVNMDGLTNLTTMRLSDNQFIGWMPTQIGKLTKLEVLRLNNNQLGLTIPDVWGQLTALRELHLMDNIISGQLVGGMIGELTELKELWMENNRIHGSIPSQIGNLQKLQTMYLDNNKFTGTIPTELGSMTTLETARLHNNKFDGSIPNEVCLLKEKHLLKFLEADCKAHAGGVIKVQCECCTCH
jgi:Leucine-rich repeat (LRR) protein